MRTNPHLDHLIAKESFAEMIRVLSPKELTVIALRLDDCPQDFTGEVLGLTRNTGYQRLKSARWRLQKLFPHIRSMVENS